VRRAAPSWLRDEAEDLTQTALMRLDKALKQDPDRRLTRAYLARIAYTTVVDELRRRRRERALTTHEIEPDRRPAGSPGPDQRVAGAAAGEAITACLEQAPPRTRDALTLYLLGHTVPEVSATLDLGRKVAENVVYRGIEALRVCLTARGYAR
jgi:RNA polymerase sigma-70 factor, ECF subfamily